MARPPIETGNPWIALLVALGALGAAVWFFAGADEAALDRPTAADRLAAVAAEHEADADLIVVPATLPPGWGEPGVELRTSGARLEQFELRLLRRYDDPEKPDAFVQVRLRVCTSVESTGCVAGGTVIREATVATAPTIVTIDDARFAEDIAAAWADVAFTTEWRSLDWPTRQR